MSMSNAAICRSSFRRERFLGFHSKVKTSRLKPLLRCDREGLA